MTKLLGIGAAAARAGVTERALRYYQQLGLLTPCASTPGGMRRYSEQDLARVSRIRQLQSLLGLNLDEIAVVLRNEDRMAQIKDAYHHEQTSDDERRELAAESLRLQLELRGTVQAKRQGIETFLADLDARIFRTRDVLDQMTGTPVSEEGRARAGRPRDPELESRVLTAALWVYAEAGWSGFSFDAVARRAGVGRAPLYLRWQSKEDLLLAALSAHSSTIPLRDCGSLRDDLVEYATRLLESRSGPESWAFLRIRLEATVNPALHARFSSEIAAPHIDAAKDVLTRALERGDLPADTPVDLLLASFYGAIFSAMTPGLADDHRRYAEHIVDFVLGRTQVPAPLAATGRLAEAVTRPLGCWCQQLAAWRQPGRPRRRPARGMTPTRRRPRGHTGQNVRSLSRLPGLRAWRSGFPDRSGGPGGSHPRAPADPGVTVSRHRAPLALTTSRL